MVANLTSRQRRQAGERREAPEWVQSLAEEHCFRCPLPQPDHNSWGMNLQAELVQPMIPASQTRPPDLNLDSAIRLEVDGTPPFVDGGVTAAWLWLGTTRTGRQEPAARDNFSGGSSINLNYESRHVG